jgi:predicted RNA-binding Zn-ribbon protein involved in translation (DUF1610 family)
MAAYLRCPHCGMETPDADVPYAGGFELVCPQCGKTCTPDDIVEHDPQ